MDLSDEVFTEIGRITVGAAGIEQLIAKLCAAMTQNELSADELMRGPSKKSRDQLRRAAREHGDQELGQAVEIWLTEITGLLEARNSIIHAEWISLIGVKGGETPAALHSKSASIVPADYIEGLGLPRRLQNAAEKGRGLLRLSWAVMQEPDALGQI
jgi:hypothetical protein